LSTRSINIIRRKALMNTSFDPFVISHGLDEATRATHDRHGSTGARHIPAALLAFSWIFFSSWVANAQQAIDAL
jgi:hypothetical protein